MAAARLGITRLDGRRPCTRLGPDTPAQREAVARAWGVQVPTQGHLGMPTVTPQTFALVGYEHRAAWDDPTERVISDWTRAETSEATGHDLVHVYTLEHRPTGITYAVGRSTALKAVTPYASPDGATTALDRAVVEVRAFAEGVRRDHHALLARAARGHDREAANLAFWATGAVSATGTAFWSRTEAENGERWVRASAEDPLVTGFLTIEGFARRSSPVPSEVPTVATYQAPRGEDGSQASLRHVRTASGEGYLYEQRPSRADQMRGVRPIRRWVGRGPDAALLRDTLAREDAQRLPIDDRTMTMEEAQTLAFRWQTGPSQASTAIAIPANAPAVLAGGVPPPELRATEAQDRTTARSDGRPPPPAPAREDMPAAWASAPADPAEVDRLVHEARTQERRALAAGDRSAAFQAHRRQMDVPYDARCRRLWEHLGSRRAAAYLGHGGSTLIVLSPAIGGHGWRLSHFDLDAHAPAGHALHATVAAAIEDLPRDAVGIANHDPRVREISRPAAPRA
jgi:hypothetical protein